MFISIEEATDLTGRSKNALYRLMAKGNISFVRCTKGKRYLEVAELRRVYGELKTLSAKPVVSIDEYSEGVDNNELVSLICQMRTELASLSTKVDQQTALIQSLSGLAPVASAIATTVGVTQPTLPVAVLADAPERDPEWPPFITCYADLAKRDEIKARYQK